jgi:hypothetical protein
MKILSFIALFCIVLLVSCSKEKGNDNFHVSFKVDGTDKTFTGYVVAHRDTITGFYTLEVIGATTMTSFGDYMGIYINNDPGHGNFNPGDYKDNSATFTVLANYVNNSISYDAGQSIAQDAVSYNVTIAHPFKVTITDINTSTIRGTFSGDFYKDGDVQGSAKVYITNGDFYAKFQ